MIMNKEENKTRKRDEDCLIKEVTEVFREMTFAQRCVFYQE